MKALLLTIILLLASCAPDESMLTCTKRKIIGPDEVRVFQRVTSVHKHGWLTSDRYHIRTADGKLHVLNGKWDMVRENK